MLFRRKEHACWIPHSHFFRPSAYECSHCRREFDAEYETCPYCGAVMDLSYEEALELLDELTDDVF